MSQPAPEPPGILGISFSQLLSLFVIALVAIAFERLITTYLSRFAKRAKLERNTANNLVLTFRIFILIAAALAVSRLLLTIDSGLILSISAVIGAALGFASQKTLGNFIAGLFLLAARPFKVGNYVKLGDVEGIVQEVTINYTKVLTIDNSTVAISNLQILDRDITNYSLSSQKNLSLYCYNYEIGFNHEVSTEKIAAICNEVFQRFNPTLPKKPCVMLRRSDAFARYYTVYLYVENPEDVFTIRPQISEEVFRRWDMERLATKTALSQEEKAKMAQEKINKKEEQEEKEKRKNEKTET